MKIILKKYLKQIAILIILIAFVSVLHTAFVKSSIRGSYATVTVGITKGTSARELNKYLKESFKKELEFNKKLEIEAVGSFGTEFRLKSDSLIKEEKEFIETKLKEKYEEAHVSDITTNPEANYRLDYIMYFVYFIIIVVLGGILVYILYLLPVDDDLSIESIKTRRNEIIQEDKDERFKLSKQEKQELKKKIKEEKLAKKEAKQKSKKNKKEKKVKKPKK